MEDQYGGRISDLPSYITPKPYYSAVSQPPDLLSCHRGVSSPYPYDMLMFRSDTLTPTPTPTPLNNLAAPTCSNNVSAAFHVGGDGGAARWPRQETLSLLEIRSRLDSKFKEAIQKGPLWDEVSRIMCEEYGYQRSGKKCREKFENLYKYYKKTRDGKGGRQDGKHYRFFRQLEALYGDPASNSPTVSETLYSAHPTFPYTNPEAYDTVSSDCSVERKGRGLKGKIKESIEEQMGKLMEKQEMWMQKMMSVIQEKENERNLREENWRREEAMRIDREHEMWANERMWMQTRDVALVEAFRKATERGGGGEWKVLEDVVKCGRKRKESDEGEVGYFIGDSYGRL